MLPPLPPSGQQVEIFHGDQQAVVVKVGGGLRSYSAGGRDVLDGYGLEEMCRSGRGQVLIPGRTGSRTAATGWSDGRAGRSMSGSRTGWSWSTCCTRARLPAGTGTRVALWVDADYGYLMVFSGNPLPEVARRWPASNRAGR